MDYYCNECDEDITSGEYDYSMDNYNRPLCRECQRDEDELICWKCGDCILPMEYDYSMEKFERALCRNCQPKKPESKPKKSVKPEAKHEPEIKKIVISEAKSELQSQKVESTAGGIKKIIVENRLLIEIIVTILSGIVLLKTIFF